jgi:hypothetical protein
MFRSRAFASVLTAALAAAPLPLSAQPQAAASDIATLPLAPGGAAGIKQAQGFRWDDIPWVFIVGGSLVIVAVVIALSEDDAATSTTNGTTGGS